MLDLVISCFRNCCPPMLWMERRPLMGVSMVMVVVEGLGYILNVLDLNDRLIVPVTISQSFRFPRWFQPAPCSSISPPVSQLHSTAPFVHPFLVLYSPVHQPAV